jgi:hypothetical protein
MGTSRKFKFLSKARREQKIATPHMFDMSGAIFCEQRSMATEVGFLEVPICLNA